VQLSGEAVRKSFNDSAHVFGAGLAQLSKWRFCVESLPTRLSK
jgi:hypothetical protein